MELMLELLRDSNFELVSTYARTYLSIIILLITI